tara:strand:- start:902 stop:2920 length:2019 start_codon:yes stop_codon:yes gene_type:complete
MAKKINIYWDSFNGVNDDLDYIEYQEFIILVKYNSRFASSTFQSQKQEADENDIDESYFTVDGRDYLESSPNDANVKLKKFQTYKLTYLAEKAGQYYFSIWAVLDGKYYGPALYPTAEEISQGNVINVDEDTNLINIEETINIYGLTSTFLNKEGVDGSPGSKSLGEGLTVAELLDQPSPGFKYRASAALSSSPETSFKGKARATIREPSSNNTPSPNIYYELYDLDIENANFVFPQVLNSLEAVAQIEEGETYYHADGSQGSRPYVITNNIKAEQIPLRHFDVVVEGYNTDTLKTSAGNKLHDNTINLNQEKSFSDGGYDILEVKLLEPSGLLFLNEYSDRDGFVSPQEAFDKNIPYIIEPRLTDEGNIDLTFIKSFNSSTETSIKPLSEIEAEYIEPLMGVVIYYSDTPFSINKEEISLDGGTKQVVTVSEQKVTVNRTFVLEDDFEQNSENIFTIPVPSVFSSKSLKQSNVIIAGFDELIYQKHFSEDGAPIVREVNGKSVETILGEKNLSFSKMAPPINTFSNYQKSEVKDTGLTTSSILMYKKSPVDEGFKSQAFRAFAYIKYNSKESIQVEQSSNLQEIFNDNLYKIHIPFKDKLNYIPIIIPYLSVSETETEVLEALPPDTRHRQRVRLVSITTEKAILEVTEEGGQGSPNPRPMKIFVGFLAIT